MTGGNARLDDDSVLTFPIGALLVGYRLRGIFLRMTVDQMVDPRVRQWLLECVYPRKASPNEVVTIELGGG